MDAVKIMGQKVKGKLPSLQGQRLHLVQESLLYSATHLRIIRLWRVHFMPSLSSPDCVINVGVSGPGVVRAAISKY